MEEALKAFWKPSFNVLPHEVKSDIFCRLNLQGLQSLHSTSKYLYALLSMKEMEPVWLEFLMRYFPDSYYMYQVYSKAPIIPKSLFRQFYKGMNNLHEKKYERVRFFCDQIDLGLSPQHKLEIYLPEGKTLGVWDLGTGKKINTIITNEFQQACIRDGSFYLLEDGIIGCRNIEDMKSMGSFMCYPSDESASLKGLEEFPFMFTIYRDWLVSSYFVSEGKWGIKVWSKKTGEEVRFLKIDEGQVSSLAARKNFAYIGLDNGSLLVWDFVNGTTKNLPPFPDKITHIVVNNDFLCIVNLDKMGMFSRYQSGLTVWALEEGVPVTKLESPIQAENIEKIDLHDHHLYVLIGGLIAYSIKVWNLKDNKNKTISISPEVYRYSSDSPITSFRVLDGLILLKLNDQGYKFLDFVIDDDDPNDLISSSKG